MRRRMAPIAAALSAAALAACAQDDQKLPFSLEDEAPVTRTVPASGDLTISTPAGLSMTLPEGAVSPGSEVTIARIDVPDLTGGPELVGNSIYVIGFDEVPQKDPVVTFTATLEKEYTAAELIGMVPVVVRVGGSGGGATFSKGLAAAGQAGNDPTDGGKRAGEMMLKLGEISGVPGGDAQLLGPPTFRLATFQELVQRFLEWVQKVMDQLGGLPPFEDSSTWANGNLPFPANFPVQFAMRGGSTGGNSWKDQDTPEWLSPDLVSYLKGISTEPEKFLVYTTILTTGTVRPTPPAGTSIGGVNHPLIPAGRTSATFEFLCIGHAVEAGLVACDLGDVDIRASQELLERFPASLLTVKYLLAEITLRDDGTAAGQASYHLAFRAPMASGITGYSLKDTLDFTGTWSASGDSIHVGGRSYRYATPDSTSVILLIEDTVRVEDNDGTERHEPVQIYLKLRRM